MTTIEQMSTYLVTIYCLIHKLEKLKEPGQRITYRKESKRNPGSQKLTTNQIHEIKRSKSKLRELAFEYGVSIPLIQRIRGPIKNSLGGS